MTIHSTLTDRYYQQQPYPRWNIWPTPLQEYRLLRSWGLSKAEHLAAADIHMESALSAETSRYEAVRAALVEHFDYDRFPADVRESIRRAEKRASDYKDASLAHWRAAGRQARTWRVEWDRRYALCWPVKVAQGRATYNGWTNRATWNVALWADSDEGLYRMRTSFVRGGWDAKSAKEFASNSLFPSGQTPDGCSLDQANWQEIADSWNEE